MVYDELGREPLYIIVKSGMVNFGAKFLPRDKRKLCYKVYVNFRQIIIIIIMFINQRQIHRLSGTFQNTNKTIQ